MEAFSQLATDGNINLQRFKEYLRNTFPECDLDHEFDTKAKIVFDHFAKGQSSLNQTQFEELWEKLLKKCTNPKSALVIVDFQHDFVNGSLSLKNCPKKENPELLLPRLNHLVDLFDDVIYTYDWHPSNHISFIENVKMRKLHSTNSNDPDKIQVGEDLIFDFDGKPVLQKMWPAHCVQNSKGAKLHEGLKVKQNAISVYKGSNKDVDSYSAFWDNSHESQTTLKSDLLKRGITNLYIVGLAFDACVCFTALDSINEGFTTTILRDVVACISEPMEKDALDKLNKSLCPVIDSASISASRLHGPVPWSLLWQQANLLRSSG